MPLTESIFTRMQGHKCPEDFNVLYSIPKPPIQASFFLSVALSCIRFGTLKNSSTQLEAIQSHFPNSHFRCNPFPNKKMSRFVFPNLMPATHVIFLYVRFILFLDIGKGERHIMDSRRHDLTF